MRPGRSRARSPRRNTPWDTWRGRRIRSSASSPTSAWAPAPSSSRPTKNGGQGLSTQARAAYYYSLGGEGLIVGDTLGVRVGIRQLFYLAPDFGQNYLTIKQRTFTTEPQIGLYLHF